MRKLMILAALALACGLVAPDNASAQYQANARRDPVANREGARVIFVAAKSAAGNSCSSGFSKCYRTCLSNNDAGHCNYWCHERFNECTATGCWNSTSGRICGFTRN